MQKSKFKINNFINDVMLVKELTKANMKSRYRNTIAGFIWVIINPLVMFGIQSIVFKRFLRLNVPNYYLFLLSGLLPWIFITQTLDMCTPLFTNSGQVLKSFKINPLTILFSQVIDNLINFIAAFCLLFIPFIFWQIGFESNHLLLPFAVLLLVFGVLGMCWFLASFQVFFRDTRYIVQFSISILFFLTPIFYPKEYIPEHLQFIILINPFYAIIEPFRILIYNFNLHDFLASYFRGILWVCGYWVLAILFWRRKRNEFYLYI